jgi:hypothetical protein
MEKAAINYDVRDGDYWERLFKFVAVEVCIGVLVVIAAYLIIVLSIYVEVEIIYKGKRRGFLDGFSGLFIGILISGVVAVYGQMVALSVYENWRGCHIKSK